MSGPRYWAALLAIGLASMSGRSATPRSIAQPVAALGEPAASEQPTINPDGLPVFGLTSRETSSPPQPIIDFVASTTNRPSKSEQRARFEEFSFQVNQDEENAARVAAGEFPVVPVGNGEPMRIEQVPFQVQIRYADRVTNAQAPGIDNVAVPRWQTRHICGGTLIDREWVRIPPR